MKIAVRYGMVIAAGIALWVVADHFLLHITGPASRLGFLTPAFFNLLQLIVLAFGIRARRSQNSGAMTLGTGIGTGMLISLVYAVLACLFFLALYLIVGPTLLEAESTSFGTNQPQKFVLIGAFGGMFFGALVGGLIYSTVISFIMRSRNKLVVGSNA